MKTKRERFRSLKEMSNKILVKVTRLREDAVAKKEKGLMKC